MTGEIPFKSGYARPYFRLFCIFLLIYYLFVHLFIYLLDLFYSSINAARSHLYEEDCLKSFLGCQFSDEGWTESSKSRFAISYPLCDLEHHHPERSGYQVALVNELAKYNITIAGITKAWLSGHEQRMVNGATILLSCDMDHTKVVALVLRDSCMHGFSIGGDNSHL